MPIDSVWIGTIGIGVFLGLILAGVPVGFSGAIVGLVGLWVVSGFDPAFTSIGILPQSIMSSFSLSVVPLFIIMGHFAVFGGIGAELYRSARQWVGSLPGGLASATVVAGSAFGAVCGTSVAAAAVFTKVALPELEKSGYDIRLSVGCIAAVGTISATIPPSAMMVVYGIMTEQSVGRLLMAGFPVGILTAVLFILLIVFRTRHNPALAPRIPGVTWRERIIGLKAAWATGLVALLVMGGIYSGIFTPTEAGAAGAAVLLVIGLARRRLGWHSLKESLLQAGRTTCSIFIIVVGVLILSQFLAITRVSYQAGAFLAGLPIPPVLILVCMLVLYLFLGMFMESVAMMVLTLPILFPASQALGFDPTWFGILVVLMCEIGLLTPPVGLNCFIVQAAAPHVPLNEIFRGVFPFLITMFVLIALLITFPQIVLFLPNIAHI